MIKNKKHFKVKEFQWMHFMVKKVKEAKKESKLKLKL
jgi:hypothetical protein